ncbi:MAG: penicillin-binding protein activator LpoB [Halobacteriovoraceae bacterium]|nr:penicillin-binding protein activator LpoB [Halobacteriovoraceae bacterium]
MKNGILIMTLLSMGALTSCGGFKAKRVDADTGDDAAMEITDKWVDRDTETVVEKTLKAIERHKGFQRYLAKFGKRPKIFIAEVQNATSEPYFPIADLNDEMLTEFSSSGEFILIDAQARDKLLKEIKYQNDGMVDPRQAKNIGRQSGADLLVFGAIRMQPRSRGGKTLKQYSINMRMTNLETSEEVLRTRVKVQKFSEQSSTGW